MRVVVGRGKGGDNNHLRNVSSAALVKECWRVGKELRKKESGSSQGGYCSWSSDDPTKGIV